MRCSFAVLIVVVLTKAYVVDQAPRDDENGVCFDKRSFGDLHVLRQCRHGMFLVNPDNLIGWHLAEFGDWEHPAYRHFAAVLPEGGTVVDVGANIGAHTVPLAQLVGEEGLVVAFEPQKACHQLLVANVALNSLSNVHTFLAAVNKDGGIFIDVPAVDARAFQPKGPNNEGLPAWHPREKPAINMGMLSLAPGEKEKPKKEQDPVHRNADKAHKVRTMSIDQLGLKACDLIKLDVEGMELQALEGARATIVGYRPVVYVERNPDKSKRQAVLRFLQGLGYFTLLWRHRVVTEDNFNGASLEGYAYKDSEATNIIAVHKDSPLVPYFVKENFARILIEE